MMSTKLPRVLVLFSSTKVTRRWVNGIVTLATAHRSTTKATEAFMCVRHNVANCEANLIPWHPQAPNSDSIYNTFCYPPYTKFASLDDGFSPHGSSFIYNLRGKLSIKMITGLLLASLLCYLQLLGLGRGVSEALLIVYWFMMRISSSKPSYPGQPRLQLLLQPCCMLLPMHLCLPTPFFLIPYPSSHTHWQSNPSVTSIPAPKQKSPYVQLAFNQKQKSQW